MHDDFYAHVFIFSKNYVLFITVLNHITATVSSSAERGIMCDKILSPDTLNVDMGDFV